MPKSKQRTPSRLDQFVTDLVALQRKHGLVLHADHDDEADLSYLGRDVPDPVVKVYEQRGCATDNPIYRGTLNANRLSSTPSIVHRRTGKLPKGIQR